ncbi:hypothetical protein DFJ63DRAFT_35619 [Scheffersomyces coipomensis]|uniref:uncharacterized protein n=1 Tax=Scheffersomyces coipomensis TaxID=1788519 RepID=UPI00315CB96A
MSCNGSCSHDEHTHSLTVRQHEQESNSNDMDDIWGDEDDENYGDGLLRVNANADIQRNHQKQGYLDGLSSAKEESLQQGFDEGFPNGALLGLTVGKLLAELKIFKDEDLFNQAKKELNIVKVLDKKYFSEDLNVTSNHEVIQKWQNLTQALQ